MFDSLLSPGPISAEVRAAYSPADKENPSKLNTRFLSEGREFAKPARESAHPDSIDNALELLRRIDVRFQLSAKLGSECLASDRGLWYRGALFRGMRNSAGDTLGLGVVVAVPKNALRAVSNESSAIGSPGLISVFQLLSRPTTTVCGHSTKDMAAMQSDENDGNAQYQNLSNCVQLYGNPSGHFLAGVPANLKK